MIFTESECSTKGLPNNFWKYYLMSYDKTRVILPTILKKTHHIQSNFSRNISVAYKMELLIHFFLEISLSEAEKEEIIEFEMDCVASMLRAKSSNGTG